MKKSLLSSLLAGAAVAALALAPQSAAAQVTASIGARADVQIALTATAVDSLIFGNVFPGTTKNILPTDATSGSFQLTGAANAQVTVDFTLPATLGDGAGNTLPITFGANSAAYNQLNARAGSTTFDPASTLTTNLDATGGNLYVYIGGSVSPTTEPAGSYTGTITLTTAYTGN